MQMHHQTLMFSRPRVCQKVDISKGEQEKRDNPKWYREVQSKNGKITSIAIGVIPSNARIDITNTLR